MEFSSSANIAPPCVPVAFCLASSVPAGIGRRFTAPGQIENAGIGVNFHRQPHIGVAPSTPSFLAGTHQSCSGAYAVRCAASSVNVGTWRPCSSSQSIPAASRYSRWFSIEGTPLNTFLRRRRLHRERYAALAPTLHGEATSSSPPRPFVFPARQADKRRWRLQVKVASPERIDNFLPSQASCQEEAVHWQIRSDNDAKRERYKLIDRQKNAVRA